MSSILRRIRRSISNKPLVELEEFSFTPIHDAIVNSKPEEIVVVHLKYFKKIGGTNVGTIEPFAGMKYLQIDKPRYFAWIAAHGGPKC